MIFKNSDSTSMLRLKKSNYSEYIWSFFECSSISVKSQSIINSLWACKRVTSSSRNTFDCSLPVCCLIVALIVLAFSFSFTSYYCTCPLIFLILPTLFAFYVSTALLGLAELPTCFISETIVLDNSVLVEKCYSICAIGSYWLNLACWFFSSIVKPLFSDPRATCSLLTFKGKSLIYYSMLCLAIDFEFKFY